VRGWCSLQGFVCVASVPSASCNQGHITRVILVLVLNMLHQTLSLSFTFVDNQGRTLWRVSRLSLKPSQLEMAHGMQIFISHILLVLWSCAGMCLGCHEDVFDC